MIDQAEAKLLGETLYDSDKLAKIMVDHITNEKGEILARVWENPGFQEVYDYKGILKQRKRLRRKQEQVFNQYDADKQLFQKVYYSPNLLLDDEVSLRQEFVRLNSVNENSIQYARGGLFLGYWPLTYVISRQVRPVGVALWTAAYYFGLYRYGALQYINGSLQSSLNKVAEPFAVKYGVRKTGEYA